MASWLVAPKWTYCVMSSASRPRSCASIGTTGVPVSAISRPISAMSYVDASQAAPIAAAASPGTSPAEAHARASAASKSSSACSQATSLVCAAASPRANMPAKRPSEGEEDSLALSLQTDVEAVRAVAGRLCDQRRAAVDRHVPEDGVLVVCLLLVAEVDARDAAVEQAAREH